MRNSYKGLAAPPQWRKHAMALLCGALLALSAVGAPAPWHQWGSRIDAQRVCAQTSPGPGWEYARGPFRDAGCRTLADETDDTATIPRPPALPPVLHPVPPAAATPRTLPPRPRDGLRFGFGTTPAPPSSPTSR